MQNRPRVLEALDSLPELMHATQLKAKILFSVVVVSIRLCVVWVTTNKLRKCLFSACFQIVQKSEGS